jgi:hypothetical protein
LTLPRFISTDPKLIRDAFDHEDFVFELKMDGFRVVAYIGKNETCLLSKGGRLMKRFANLGTAICTATPGSRFAIRSIRSTKAGGSCSRRSTRPGSRAGASASSSAADLQVPMLSFPIQSCCSFRFSGPGCGRDNSSLESGKIASTVVRLILLGGYPEGGQDSNWRGVTFFMGRQNGLSGARLISIRN